MKTPTIDFDHLEQYVRTPDQFAKTLVVLNMRLAKVTTDAVVDLCSKVYHETYDVLFTPGGLSHESK